MSGTIVKTVSISGGQVSIAGTTVVSLGTDALADIKALRATEIQEINSQNHFRVYAPEVEYLLERLLMKQDAIVQQLQLITDTEIEHNGN